jgi:hypothetical protein
MQCCSAMTCLHAATHAPIHATPRHTYAALMAAKKGRFGAIMPGK